VNIPTQAKTRLEWATRPDRKLVKDFAMKKTFAAEKSDPALFWLT
jgi:hypothetical protein